MTHLSTFLRRSVASTVGAALVLLLTAPAALAHDRLKASSPANNAKVDRVETIELEFTSLMTMPTVLLEGPHGEQVPVTKPRAEGVKVSTSPQQDLAAGKYRIAWRVISSDGHPIQGEIRFTVTAPPSPSESTTSEPTATESATAQPSPTTSETPLPASAPPSSLPAEPAADATASAQGSGVPGWIWAAVGVLVLGGGAVAVAGRRKRGSDSA